jgi:hypothetical protein
LPASGIAAAPALFEARWILIFAQPGVKGDRVIIPRMGIRFAILSIFGQMHLAYISAWLVFRRNVDRCEKLPVSHLNGWPNNVLFAGDITGAKVHAFALQEKYLTAQGLPKSYRGRK